MKLFTTSLIISLSIILSSFATLDGLAAPKPSRVLSGAAYLTNGLSVSGESAVAIGDTVVLSPVDADGCSITWTPIQGIELIGKMVQTNEQRAIINDDLEFIGLPISSLVFKPSKSGTIRFQCTAIDWDKRKFFQVIHSVTVSGKAKPDDEKEPDDDKPEPPKPEVVFSKTDYLVLIEESEERSAKTAAIVMSEWWQLGLVRDGYNKPLIKDDDGAGKDFVTTAKASGSYSDVPFIAIMDKDGNLVSTFALPDTVYELKKELGL